MKKHILLIEDEQSIADTISYALEKAEFQVSWETLGLEGVKQIRSTKVDLIILDIGLPDIDGFEACKMIRQYSEVPIIFLTARSDEIDRIVGLEIGGDDYVTKPFSPRELIARVKVILKRLNKTVEEPSGGFYVNEEKASITLHGQSLVLTRYEYRLLKLFISNPERVFSRNQLMDQVWESPEFAMDRTVDSHIKTIRAKLRKFEPDTEFVKTHRGMGYSFCLPTS